MPERATLYEGLQIGAETTPGTGVAAGKRLLCTKAGLIKPNIPITPVMGQGSSDHVAAYSNREWAEFPLAGELSYNDISYWLAGNLVVPTGGATFIFAPTSFGPNTIKTFSVERGSSVRAEKIYYCFVPDLTITFTLRGCTISGRVIGRAEQEGATLTTTPTIVPALPVGTRDWDVLVGTAVDGSDAVALTRCLEAEFRSTGRNAPGFFATPAQDSFTTHVETAGQRQLRFVVERDSEGAALMTAMRAVTTKYLKIRAVQGSYTILIECPCNITEADPSDQDNIVGITYIVTPIYSSTFNTTGGAIKITVTGTITAL